MPNQQIDPLFQLIKSLEPFEKRHFKMYMKKITDSSEDLKIIQLFNELDASKYYDETNILKKNKGIKKTQISNLKANLYQNILISLRLIKQKENIDLQLHELLDFAKIVYNKGLYAQSLKIIQKIKEIANFNHQVTYLSQALFLEKKIEALHITRSMHERANVLCKESVKVNNHLNIISHFSNISLQLYSLYIKNGHARNKEDIEYLESVFESEIKPYIKQCKQFYERIYLYQCYCWYHFIRQDFLHFYKYSKKWVLTFKENPKMIEIETTIYIKGMHNLLTALFDNRLYGQFVETISEFEVFTESKFVLNNKNNQVQSFVYLHLAKINQYFLAGKFSEGIVLIPSIEMKLKQYEFFLDKHRILIFYYKFACLYFGSENYNKCIDYLNQIINWNTNLRTDIQCYARFLLLIAHFELGNKSILPSLTKSVYRFLLNMKNLNAVEKTIFSFLQQTTKTKVKELKPAFEKLLAELKIIEKGKIDNRAFLYLDIISWLESKIQGKSIEKIYLQRLEKINC